jgi:hypothetical protein
MNSFFDRLKGSKSDDDSSKEGHSTLYIIGLIIIVLLVVGIAYMWYTQTSYASLLNSAKSLFSSGRGMESYKPVSWQAMKMPPTLRY